MRSLTIAALAFALSCALLLGRASQFCAPAQAQSSGAGNPGFRVIVHPSNPVKSVDRRFLTDAFLKRSTRWADAETIRPVDLPVDAPARRRFSEDVLNRSVAAVSSYWQQLIFSGRDVPPPQLDSDDAVVRYVLKYPGAIGYVSGNAELSGTKVLTIR